MMTDYLVKDNLEKYFNLLDAEYMLYYESEIENIEFLEKMYE